VSGEKAMGFANDACCQKLMLYNENKSRKRAWEEIFRGRSDQQ
jgi:hypothetical protein